MTNDAGGVCRLSDRSIRGCIDVGNRLRASVELQNYTQTSTIELVKSWQRRSGVETNADTN